MRRIALAVTLGLSSFLAGCNIGMSEEAMIKQEIAEANHCETADDCVFVGSKCPFDCYIYANTSEADRVKTLVDGYESMCQYSCLASKGVACENNTCVMIPQ